MPQQLPRSVRRLRSTERAVTLFNARLTPEPLYVAQPRTERECVDVIRFARDAGVAVSVGGAGFGAQPVMTHRHGLWLDLSSMPSHVRLEHNANRAVIAGPTTLAELDRCCAPCRRAAPLPRFGSLGVIATALGGGTGLLTRRAGMLSHTICAARIILADGRLEYIDADHERDLLWALAGAGQGNFGVVSELTLRTQPLPEAVHGGVISYPITYAREVFALVRELLDELGAELSVFTGLRSRGPHGPNIELFWCCTASRDRGARALRALSSIAPILTSDQGESPYEHLQRLFRDPAGRRPRFAWDHGFVRPGFSKQLIDRALEFFSEYPDAEVRVNLEAMGCASKNPHLPVDPGDSPFLYVAAVVWEDESLDRSARAVHTALTSSVRSCLDRRGHPNYDDPWLRGRGAGYYFGRHAPRLRALRDRYDPDHVFVGML